MKIELIIGDNSIDFPKDMEFRKTESLGLHLITLMADNQLEGKINLNRNNGTGFQIKFKREK
jgi:two-component sensor histidine kinase